MLLPFRLMLSLGIALLVFSAVIAWTNVEPTPVAPSSAAGEPGAKSEQEFLMGVIPHHRQAIVMAELALERASRDEVRTLAQTLIETQEAEIETMTQWLREWFGQEPPDGTMMPPHIMEGMMPMLDDTMPHMDAWMQQLTSLSGDEFDVQFLSAMYKHHAMQLMMTGPVLISGSHPELRDLAEDIALSQAAEIKLMGDYLEELYGVEQPLEGPHVTMPHMP